MTEKELLEIIFNGSYEMNDKNNACMEILTYGLENKKLLYIDYKGEENQEIVNYILDYEFENGLELASEEELEYLEEFDYMELPEKIKKVNKIIEKKSYGLFSYPTFGDFYALFLAKLDYKAELLKNDICIKESDERIPVEEKKIQYYY